MNKLLTVTFTAVLLMTIAAQATDRNEKIVFATKASFKSDMSGLADE